MTKNEKKPGEQVLATSKTTTPGGTYTKAIVERLTVHVFFDGTGNNRFNTASDRENPNTSPKGSVSYKNYYSNIALLFMAMKEFDDVKKIYIQGSGTAKGEADNTKGLGLATGATGREVRIRNALTQLGDITTKIDGSKVTLNVYGFSRGAAWARYFCHVIKTRNVKWKRSKINFVGIYDTVSSDSFTHYDDVNEMGLDIGQPQGINYIAHLTAQNEYREHFPLTSIHGAIKDKIGFECSLPGAHSDIGGGYSETADEKNRFLGFKEHKLNIGNLSPIRDEYIDYNWFFNKGYYLPKQITEKTKNYSDINGRNIPKIAFYANRTIKFHYQLVSCSIMYEIAKRKANFSLNKGTYFEKHLKEMKNISLLKKFHDSALNYVLANYTKNTGGHKVPFLAEAEMKTIFNEYIHSSLTYNAIDNKGTILNKTKNADGTLNYGRPTRPKVIKGFR